jgi:hypothetical protein
MLEQIDRVLFPWPPPPTTSEEWLPVVRVALRGLTGPEHYEMLLSGPGRWRAGRLAEGTVESLGSRAQHRRGTGSGDHNVGRGRHPRSTRTSQLPD